MRVLPDWSGNVHTQRIADFTSCEYITLKVKLNEDDVIVESDTISMDNSFEMVSLFDHEVLLTEVNSEDIFLSDESMKIHPTQNIAMACYVRNTAWTDLWLCNTKTVP